MKKLSEIWARRTTRAYAHTGLVTQKNMELFFEAAMQAPSSGNAQPWRFWYAKTDSAQGEKLLALLAPKNAAWAKDADWLVLVGAAKFRTTASGEVKLNDKAHFDTGAACLNFVLQVFHSGFACATVGGFSKEEAAALIDDDAVEPLVIIVVGSPAHYERIEAKRNSVEQHVQQLSDPN